MGFTLLQTNGTTLSGTSGSVAFSSSVTPGSLLIAMGGGVPSGLFNLPTDTPGDSWVLAVQGNPKLGRSANGFFCLSGLGGSTTVNFSWPTSSNPFVIIAEYAITGTPSLDAKAVSGGTSNHPTVSLTTSFSDELIVMCGMEAGGGGGTITPDSGYAVQGNFSNGHAPWIDNFAGSYLNSPGAKTAGFTWGGGSFDYTAVAMTFNLTSNPTRQRTLVGVGI